MNLALDNLRWLICYKNKPNQIKPIRDRTLTGIIYSSWSGYESNSTERVILSSQISRTGTSASDSVKNHTQHNILF